jgi:branched-chain amino acid transport system substrate-binding protein
VRRVKLIGIWGIALFFALRFLGVCSGSSAPTETIEIGGDMSTYPSFDIAVRDGAALAIARAHSVRGYPLRFVPYDDSLQGAYSPDQGAQNMDLMVADPRMLGMVGPLRGPVVPAELPIANPAALAMISPTVSEPCLTRPLGRCSLFNFSYGSNSPEKEAALLRPTGKNNYFHLAATDQLHGPAMAEFAYHTLGVRRIAVVEDTYGFGSFASDNFVAAFTKAGGTVVARHSFELTGQSSPDFRPWLLQARAAGAEGIYAGGLTEYSLGPRLQSQGIFDPNSPYLGIDGVPDLFHYGISDLSCPIQAATGCSAPTGSEAMLNSYIYATRGIGAPYLNPRAASTIAAFVKLHPDPLENNSETFAGYDAAAILIDAIGRAIDANLGKVPSRQQVVNQLSKTKNFSGLTGTYSFTADGDPATANLQILQYQAGSWTALTNITIANE